jgi:cobalt/nickel transport protein
MSRRIQLPALILAGLAVTLFVAVFVSSFASPKPDGLESAVLKTQCADAADPDACLAEAAGDPVYDAAPLPDYEITWLSGLLGVLACFAVGGVLALLARQVRHAEQRQPQRVRKG